MGKVRRTEGQRRWSCAGGCDLFIRSPSYPPNYLHNADHASSFLSIPVSGFVTIEDVDFWRRQADINKNTRPRHWPTTCRDPSSLIPTHRHEFSLPPVQARTETTTSVLCLQYHLTKPWTSSRTSFKIRLTRLQGTSPGAYMLMILRFKSTR